MTGSGRVGRYRAVADRLGALDDREIMALLDGATPGGAGIGGATASLRLDAVPVFVKRVPLTDLERRAEHVGSTANLFGLPTFYQYGLGSTGFGAWREVAAHEMATRWALDGDCPNFPLLYHRRVLPVPPDPMPPDELDRWVATWDDSPAVRARLTAISGASASVVLFMEHIPRTVTSWLAERVAAGGQAAASALALVERELTAVVRFLGARGLLHFDAHFHNLLTDGHRLYFTDFGLAIHDGFALSADERAFFQRHASYDRCYTTTHLTHWLIGTLRKIPWPESHAYVRDQAPRGYPDLPAPAAAILRRHAPVAVVMGEFFRTLLTARGCTPYPAEELAQALAG